MKKTSLLALSLIGPFAFLTPAHAAEKAPAGINADAKRDLAKIFDGKLTDGEGKPVKTDNLKKAKYVAVYFSAHWCPPCRKFTPELVKFTNDNRKDGNFEVVFVSSDRSEKDMLGYMTEAKMPWGGVMKKGAKLDDVGGGFSGIPHLRVFDAEGKVAIDTDYDKGMYPAKVLEELKSKLK
jgi:nucleoredoxin